MGENRPEETIEIEGQPRKGKEVGIEDLIEKWNTYSLEDGTVIRLKTVASKVVKTVDFANPQKKDEPIYRAFFTTIINAFVSDEAKKELEEKIHESGDSGT